MGVSVHFCVAPAGAEPRAAAHTLLLTLASTLVDSPTLTHDETGRPHIPGLAVSITHTPHQVAVAATYDGPLGIDLEELHPRNFTPLANRWFTPQELTWLNTQPDHLTAFLHLWTAKEAVAKAQGQGLPTTLHRQMPLPHTNGPLRAQPLDDNLAVIHIPVARAVLAIAATPDISELVMHQVGRPQGLQVFPLLPGIRPPEDPCVTDA